MTVSAIPETAAYSLERKPEMANSKAQPVKGDGQDNTDVTPVINENRPSYRFRDFVQREAENTTDGNWEITARQLDTMLMGETLEEIMESDEGGTHQGRDLTDFEFQVDPQNYRYAKSSDEFEAPLGVYLQFTATALMDYPDENITVGEEVLISTGAPLVIGKLRTLQARNLLPQKLMIKGYRGGGGMVLKLRLAPNRTVTSTTA